MANACSGAIEMALSVLANPGQNVLVPTPCFGLYQCHAECRDVQLKFYKLLVSVRTHPLTHNHRDPPLAGERLGV